MIYKNFTILTNGYKFKAYRKWCCGWIFTNTEWAVNTDEPSSYGRVCIVFDSIDDVKQAIDRQVQKNKENNRNWVPVNERRKICLMKQKNWR